MADEGRDLFSMFLPGIARDVSCPPIDLLCELNKVRVEVERDEDKSSPRPKNTPELGDRLIGVGVVVEGD